jgi:hypothetical protein
MEAQILVCVCTCALTQNFPADFHKVLYFGLNKVTGVGRISIWSLLGKYNSYLAEKTVIF